MRLIDADRLIEILNDWWFKVRSSTYEPKKVKAILKITANVIGNCIDIVNEQSTAYDIDKVIKELEEHYSCDVGALKMISLDKAMEIVKRGAE